MARYRFVSTARFAAPIDAVWETLRSPQAWQSARYVERVETLDNGDESGVGERRRYVVRSPLKHTLAFEMTTTAAKRPHLWETAAVGALEGTGRWDLDQEDGVTRATFTWEVATTKPWMNAVAPLARPLFGWATAGVIRDNAQTLADHLPGELLAIETHSVPRARLWPRLLAVVAVAGLLARRQRRGR